MDTFDLRAGVMKLTNRFYYLNYNDLYDTLGLIETTEPAVRVIVHGAS